MNWHPTFKCFVDSGLTQNALEIQPHPKEVADLDDEQIKKVKERFKEQPKKYDLDKMAKKIDELEKNLKAVKLKGTPEQYRKLQDELEKLRRQYQSVYKNEPKKTNGFAEKVGSYKGYDLAVTFDGDNSESAVLLKKITGDKTKSPHWVAYALDKNKRQIGSRGHGKTKQEAIDKIKLSIDRFEKSQKDDKSYWDKRLKDTKPKTEPKPGYEWQFGDEGWTEIKKQNELKKTNDGLSSKSLADNGLQDMDVNKWNNIFEKYKKARSDYADAWYQGNDSEIRAAKFEVDRYSKFLNKMNEEYKKKTGEHWTDPSLYQPIKGIR